jgi:hypothetical protein
MNCRQFENHLQIVLDQRLPADEDPLLAEHAWQCAACREALQIQQQILSLAGAGVPQVALGDRVWNELQVGSSRRQSWLRLGGLAAALAAAILLALMPLARFWKTPAPALVPSPATMVNTTPQSETPAATPSPRSDVEFVKQLPPEYRQLVTTITAQINEVDARQSVDQLAGGLRQFTSPFGIAIDVLRKNLPLRNKEKQREPQADARALPWIA